MIQYIFFGLLIFSEKGYGTETGEQVRQLQDRIEFLLRIWPGNPLSPYKGENIDYDFPEQDRIETQKLLQALKNEKDSERLREIEERLEVYERKWGPKSRNFFSNARALVSVIWEKRKQIMETLPHLLEVLQQSGLHGIAVLMEPVVQDIMNDVKTADLKDGVERLSQKIEAYLEGISLLQTFADNKSLVTVSHALNGLAQAGEYLTGTPRSTSARLAQEILASQILSTVLQAETVEPINYLREVIEGVCPYIK